MLHKQNSEMHLCEMFLCRDCRKRGKSIVVNGDLTGPIFDKAYKEKNGRAKQTEKVDIGCKESCLCKIF